MPDTSLLLLAIGPVSLMINADRVSKGISDAQLERKWRMLRTSPTERSAAHRTTVGVAVDRSPEIRVECGRTSR